MDFRVDGGWWQRLHHAVLPPHCLLCGLAGAPGRDLCGGCARDLLRHHCCCPRCALPLAAPAPLCGECLQREPAFAAAYVPYIYAAPLDLLVGKLKFGHSLAAGRVLADLWIDALRSDAPQRPDVLAPIPLHPARLRERGYNQALELARPLARALGSDLAPDLLQRTRATPAQANLDAAARRRNLRGAFAVNENAAAGLDRERASVALVDDVMTTGATLRECARALRRAGFTRVSVWAFARAPKSR
jgi:ComF family protein